MYNRWLCKNRSRVLATVKIAASAVPIQITTCHGQLATLVVVGVPVGAVYTYIEMLRRDVVDTTRGVVCGLGRRSGAEIHWCN